MQILCKIKWKHHGTHRTKETVPDTMICKQTLQTKNALKTADSGGILHQILIVSTIVTSLQSITASYN